MKHPKLILLMATFMTIISCNKNELAEAGNDADAKVIYTMKPLIATDEMLSFNSEEEMHETAVKLSEMDIDGLKAWHSSTNSNFKSIELIHKEAISEFEEFSTLVNGDFKTADQIKSKYKDILLFNNNPQDEELYSPLIPISESFYSFVCNKNGDVMVNGSVKNFKDLKSFEETRYYKTSQSYDTKAIEEKENYIWILDGKRKMWVNVLSRPPQDAVPYHFLALELEARKKNWLGWCSYATIYTIQIEESFVGIRPNMYLKDWSDFAARGFVTEEVGAGHKLNVVCFDEWPTKITAKLRISSRGTGGQSALLTINKSAW